MSDSNPEISGEAIAFAESRGLVQVRALALLHVAGELAEIANLLTEAGFWRTAGEIRSRANHLGTLTATALHSTARQHLKSQITADLKQPQAPAAALGPEKREGSE